MGGSPPSTTTVADNDPWEGVQPYLSDAFSKAMTLHNDGVGTDLYQGPFLADQSADTLNSMNAIRGIAGSTDSGFGLRAGSGMIGNEGLSGNMTGGLYGLGSMGAGNTAIGGMMGSNGGPMGRNGLSAYMSPDLGDMGAMGRGDTAVSDFMSQATTNPHLETMLNDNADRIGNRMSSAMSGAGRYGSFGHGDAMARSITAANAPILASAYESDQNRMLQASGMQDATRLGAMNSRLGFLGEGLNRGMNAAGMEDQTRLNAMNSQLGFLNSGMDRSANMINSLPALNELQYDPALKLAALGNMEDTRSQTELDEARNLYEQQRNLAWEQLGKYQASLSGLSGLIPNTGNSMTTHDPGDAGAMPFLGAGIGLLSLL